MDEATLRALRAFPDQTARDQVCHVRDIEIEGYQPRIARTLAEETPVLPAIDTDALSHDRRYGEDDAAVFEGYGPVTLRGLVHYLCSHDQQHLAGLQWLLGKIESRGR